MNALNCRFIGEFEKGEMIGEGTYGVVFFARDKKTEEKVAIKKMKVLDNQDGFPITSLREVKILKMLGNHPNIVKLREVVVGLKSESVFLVFEHCEIDLYKLMSQMLIDKSSFSEAEVKCLGLQLIKGVSVPQPGQLRPRKVHHPPGPQAEQPPPQPPGPPQDR